MVLCKDNVINQVSLWRPLRVRERETRREIVGGGIGEQKKNQDNVVTNT